MSTPSRTLSALFGLALLGVLVVGGLVAAMLGGLPVLAGYAVVVVLLLVLGVVRMRKLVPDVAPPARACTCCGSDGAGDHTQPVTVL